MHREKKSKQISSKQIISSTFFVFIFFLCPKETCKDDNIINVEKSWVIKNAESAKAPFHLIIIYLVKTILHYEKNVSQ